MKIYYSPEYSGFTFTGLKAADGLLYDSAVVDTSGLLKLLCLHGGMHIEEHDGNERLIAYYKAMRKYCNHHPDNVFAQSFNTDGLNTAKVCLSWRDWLVLAGWSADTVQPGQRMAAMKGIEELFDCSGIVDELPYIIDCIKNCCTLPDNLIIITLTDYSLFHPAIIKLLDALKERGVRISALENAEQKSGTDLQKITSILNGTDTGRAVLGNDGSVSILEFEEKDDALRYLALLDDGAFDVWIAADTKRLDNWLRLSGRPVSGSSVTQCMPQISQLFVIGLGLFSKPLNVNMLLEWLYAPMTPVGAKLARRLTNTVIRCGGYFNKECEDVIEKYLNGEYDWFDNDMPEADKKAAIKKKRVAREYAVNIFLPRIKEYKEFAVDSTDNNADVKRLTEFTAALDTWCKQQIAMTDDDDRKAQLNTVVSETEAVMLLLDDIDGDTVPFSNVENWMGSLYKYADYRQYRAQRNCRNVISAPCKMAAKAEKTIWCDFAGAATERLTYSFLEPSEKKAFRKTLSLWDEKKEQNYRRALMLVPFNMTERQITLVTYKRDGGTVAEKQPMMIHLEQQTENIDSIVGKPVIDAGLLKDAEIIDNKNDAADEFIHLSHKDSIKFPDHESYSSLSLMYQSPVDYVFGYIAGIWPVGASAMSPLNTTKGNVAHAVIQTLFWNKDNKESGYPDFIEKNLRENYDSVFSQIVNAYGAIMLLQENILDTLTYKEQLRQCAERLLAVIKNNALHVTGIETFVKNKLGFADDISLLGYIDMFLADIAGRPYIFDFKWSGNQKYYSGLLKANKSLQLSLYRALVNSIEKKKVSAVGYFLMPEGRLFTVDGLTGENVVHVDVDPERAGKDLIAEMRNSYSYRREQIAKGLVELGDGDITDDLQYGKDCEEKDLVPFDTDDKGCKAPYKFSNYTCFKRK